MNSRNDSYKFRDFTGITIVAILSLLLLLTTIYKPLNQDEGVFLTIGKFLHYGVLPYRDIFDHKPPGIYFLNYLILGITSNLIIVKIVFTTINLFSIFLITKIYLIIVHKPRYVYLPAIFSLLMLMIFEGNYLIAEVPMTLCVLLALYFALCKDKYYFLIGFFCGLAIIFKQTALLSSLVIIIYSVFKYKKNIFKIIWGFLLPILMVLLYLVVTKTLRDGFEQIIWLNLCCYPREQVGFVLSNLSFYFFHSLPILILALVEIYFVIKNYQSEKNMIIIIMLLLLPIPLLLIRHYPHYWIQIIPFFSLLAAAGMERFLNNKFFVVKYIILASIILMVISNSRWLLWQFKNNYVQKYQDQSLVISYLQKNNLNEIVAENQFSFFSSYNNKLPTKYLYITEINNQNSQAEEETISSLKQNKNITVLWPVNQKLAYAKELQQYILENYQKKTTFSNLGLVIYIKK